jgi:hypothetical protein
LTCGSARPGTSLAGPGGRVNTDKRDALRLARLLAAGDLTLVVVPPVEHERVRDLVRCREDVRGDLMRVRHRVSKFLLRRELYFPGSGQAWTGRHRDWLSGLRFDDRASELCFADYLHAHDVLLARRDGLDRALAEIAQDCPWSAPVARLRSLRGVDTLTALGLCAEVSDFGRFPGPQAVAAYLGLVPCEASSGGRRRQGAITKAGRGSRPYQPFSARGVAARIRAVLRWADAEGPAPGDGALEVGPVRIDSDRRSVSLDDDLKLTCKEFELLELLLREAGNLVSREQLIDEVQDVNWVGSTKTLGVPSRAASGWVQGGRASRCRRPSRRARSGRRGPPPVPSAPRA